jgi:hypothetical protein
MSRAVESATHEFRVVFLRPGATEWQTLITNRGGGRPYFSRGAAQGVLTRAQSKNDRWRLNENTHRQARGEPLLEKTQYKIQSRPIEAAWTDIDEEA